MRAFKTFFLALLLLVGLSNCASVLSKSAYRVSLTSLPKDALVTIKNNKGEVIFQDLTPTSTYLEASAGYFKKASYTLTFTKLGFEERVVPLTATLDGWYLGNILFGGFIGILIIDPATGAMYKIPQTSVRVRFDEAASASNAESLRIIDLEDVPEHWRSQLVKIK